MIGSGVVGGAPEGAPPALAQNLFAEHVHAADLGGLTVLLDLKRDRYLSAPSAALAKLTSGEAGAELLGERLVREGLIEAAPRRDWFRFWRACAWASRAVSSKRLDRALDELRKFRRRNGANHGAQAIVQSFDFMRPWYPHRMVCLFDSLALMRLLTDLGAGGEIVFGVRGMPFAAHCWVEQHGSPLNDEAEYCASFRPILRV